MRIFYFDVTARSCEYFSFMKSDISGIVVIVSKKAPLVGKLLTLEKVVITYCLPSYKLI